MIEVKEKSRDHWEGGVFILAGQKYGLGKTLATICAGPVQDTPHDRAQALPDGAEVVLQQGINGNVLRADSQAVVMQQKHAGGRPKKEGEVHRSTEWRRNKETQGLLI